MKNALSGKTSDALFSILRRKRGRKKNSHLNHSLRREFTLTIFRYPLGGLVNFAQTGFQPVRPVTKKGEELKRYEKMRRSEPKRILSEEARAAISHAQKKRWREY